VISENAVGAAADEEDPRRYDLVLDEAVEIAKRWLDGVFDRPIPPSAEIEQVKSALGRQLPADGDDPRDVIVRLAAEVEPGVMAMQSPRFYGWVIGGTYPAALAADWLVSTWDQNTAMRAVTPGVVAVEELAGEWVVDLLGLPSGAEVGFVTGATMANFVGMSAGRQRVLAQAGWDANRDGLAGGPKVRFIVGAERHGSVDIAGRYLGLGAPTVVDADDQGRILVDRLREVLPASNEPAIVCLQAGNLHSGAFDDFGAAIAVAHEAGAWVHIDGAFGLWAGATPGLRHLTSGYEAADSWATDGHKTLNVPYDCGIAIVSSPDAVHEAFGMRANYLQAAQTGTDPHERVPELSRRARGVPLWAALSSLGRLGVEQLIDGLAANAAALARGLVELDGVEILNDVVYTQVCMSLPDDARTTAVGQRLREDGVVLASPSRWRDRDVLRFSVSNWATDDADIAATVEAVRRAIAARP
jgi:glutamate/tyrosine decarboxylase-like PLP-dependent enzyme